MEDVLIFLTSCAAGVAGIVLFYLLKYTFRRRRTRHELPE